MNTDGIRSRLLKAINSDAPEETKVLLTDALNVIDVIQQQIHLTYPARLKFAGDIQKAVEANPEARMLGCAGNVTILGPKG